MTTISTLVRDAHNDIESEFELYGSASYEALDEIAAAVSPDATSEIMDVVANDSSIWYDDCEYYSDGGLVKLAGLLIYEAVRTGIYQYADGLSRKRRDILDDSDWVLWDTHMADEFSAVEWLARDKADVIKDLAKMRAYDFQLDDYPLSTDELYDKLEEGADDAAETELDQLSDVVDNAIADLDEQFFTPDPDHDGYDDVGLLENARAALLPIARQALEGFDADIHLAYSGYCAIDAYLYDPGAFPGESDPWTKEKQLYSVLHTLAIMIREVRGIAPGAINYMLPNPQVETGHGKPVFTAETGTSESLFYYMLGAKIKAAYNDTALAEWEKGLLDGFYSRRPGSGHLEYALFTLDLGVFYAAGSQMGANFAASYPDFPWIDPD